MKYISSLFDGILPTWENNEIATGSQLLNLGLASVLIGIVIVPIFTNKLSRIFVIVWFLGFCIYDVGMYTGDTWSLIGNSFMAIIHAFGMFVFESDVSAIVSRFHNNSVYMTCFSLVHLAAACISLVFVISHFVYLIKSKLKMFFSANQTVENTYIFWGINSASHFLAKDIQNRTDLYSKNRIVFVRTDNENRSTNLIEKIEQYIFSQPKSDEIPALYDLNDCLTTSTFVKLGQLAQENSDSYPDILGRVLNLKLLKRIITHEKCGKLHIFFLSDDENENIHSVEILRRDESINALASNGTPVKIYCHARYNSIHREIEDERYNTNIEVKIIDSSRISVNEIKMCEALQPVNFVDVEENATVSSPFNSMVVGFGEVGLYIVRFLYEFGTFVSHKSDSDNVIRSDFQCDVIDNNMETLVGPFTASAPGIRTNQTIEEDGTANSEPLINFHQVDCRSIEFYKLLKQRVGNLNYIVICTNDDELNTTLAISVLQYAIRYRKDLKHFQILVRVQNDDDRHFYGIISHHNRLLAAERCVKTDHSTHQATISNYEQIDSPITIFGLEENAYTYDNIIRDKLVCSALEFKTRYDSALNEMLRRAGLQPFQSRSWDEEYRDLMQMSGDYMGYSPSYSKINRLRRIQSQHVAVRLHVLTKQILAKTALGENKYVALSEHKLFRREYKTEYFNADGTNLDWSIQKVLDVLAQTEHLRWCAAHYILGYINTGDFNHKSEAKLEHGCLKPWNNLPTQIKSYDYTVVDASLGII